MSALGGATVGTMSGLQEWAASDDWDELALPELLTRWNRMFWWSGVRPMLQRMVEADLTTAESIVLRTLRHGPLTVAAAGQCLRLSHSAASRAVDRLVRDGYVRREENPDDRRQKLLTLAPLGADLVGEMEGIAADGLHQLILGLADEDREALRGLLARMLRQGADRIGARDADGAGTGELVAAGAIGEGR